MICCMLKVRAFCALYSILSVFFEIQRVNNDEIFFFYFWIECIFVYFLLLIKCSTIYLNVDEQNLSYQCLGYNHA